VKSKGNKRCHIYTEHLQVTPKKLQNNEAGVYKWREQPNAYPCLNTPKNEVPGAQNNNTVQLPKT